MKADHKNIIVTGGGNGVGRQLVLELLSRGATVIAVDKNQLALNETILISENNSRLYTHAVDISNQEDVAAFTAEAASKYKVIDGLINCAGIIQPFINLEELDFPVIDRVMNVNFYGTLYMTKSFLPYLKKRPEAHLVNISSMGGFLPVPGQGIYGASKAAVKAMTEALHSELADTAVKVTVVFPGGVATDIKVNSDIKGSKPVEQDARAKIMLSPQQAAKQIIEAMEKNRFQVFIGKDCRIMNVLYRLRPQLAIKLIQKVMAANSH